MEKKKKKKPGGRKKKRKKKKKKEKKKKRKKKLFISFSYTENKLVRIPTACQYEKALRCSAYAAYAPNNQPESKLFNSHSAYS